MCMPFLSKTPASVTDRLVKDIYPKAKDSSSPDSNSQGKLLFHASHNPSSLPDIASALLRRAVKYSAGSSPKYVNALIITLKSLQLVIIECKANLAFFATQAIAIITAGTRSKDVHILQAAGEAFYPFSTYCDSKVMLQDQAFTEDYGHLVSLFADHAQSKLPQIKAVGLYALSAVSGSDLLYNAGHFAPLADCLIQAAIANIAKSDVMDLQTFHQKATDTNDRVSDFSKTLTHRRSRTFKLPEKEVAEKSDLVYGSALDLLYAIFSLATPPQANMSLDMLLKRFAAENTYNNSEWCQTLLLHLVERSRPERRYGVVNNLVKQIPTSTPLEAAVLLDSINIILRSSECHLIGLNASELVDPLLAIIVAGHTHTAKAIKAVEALASRQYYANQIEDITQEIITSLLSLYSQPDTTEATQLQLLDTLGLVLSTDRTLVGSPRRKTFESQESPSKSGRRNPISPDSFQPSLVLLTSGSQHVRSSYAGLLYSYLTADFVNLLSTNRTSRKRANSFAFDGSNEVEKFLHALAAASFGLVTARFLGVTGSAASSANTSPRKLSKAMTNGLPQQEERSTQPRMKDFAAVQALLSALLDKQDYRIPLAMVPMLLALDESASYSLSAQDGRKARCCKELVSSSFETLSYTWESKQLASVSHSINLVIGSPIIPDFFSSPDLTATPPITVLDFSQTQIEAERVISSLSSNALLHEASGLTASRVTEILAEPWSMQRAYERAVAVQSPVSSPIRSPLSFASPLSALPTLEIPSVSDLRYSLGYGNSASNSIPASSQQPSITVSQSGDTLATMSSVGTEKRRVTNTAELLEKLNRIQVDNSPEALARTVVEPPYA